MIIKPLKHTVPFLLAILTAGCATYTGWTPVVDSYNDPNRMNLQQDMADCQALARQAGSVGTETLKGTAMGGLGGAALGAALGAITGNPATGAALGAAAGGIGGGGYAGMGGDEQFKRAYINCLRTRGHKVIN
jgi:outer membrane lipoprotein SlyB